MSVREGEKMDSPQSALHIPGYGKTDSLVHQLQGDGVRYCFLGAHVALFTPDLFIRFN
jgi:hypothetical protein